MSAIMAGMELQPCGTVAAYQRHLYHKQQPCDDCKAAVAAWQKAWRHQRGSKPYKEPECGTHSGYCRHIYLDEAACAACKKAHSEYQMAWLKEKRRRARRGTWADVVLDHVETYDPVQYQELLHLIRESWPEARDDTIRKTVWRLEDAGRVYRSAVSGALRINH